MELLILGWYILVQTGSVLLLTVFGALQYVGTLIAPLFGLAGDRLGHRNVLCSMRVVYATLALLTFQLDPGSSKSNKVFESSGLVHCGMTPLAPGVPPEPLGLVVVEPTFPLEAFAGAEAEKMS